MEDNTHWINTARIPQLEERVAKVNKRAAKLSVDPFTLTISNTTRLMRETRDGSWVDVPAGTEIEPDWTLFEQTLVTLEGEPVKLAGWTFVGALEHTEAGNVLHSAPDQTVDPRYREAGPDCEHCGFDRRRNDTYIVQHEDGTQKQVGRTCLKDFMGHQSPEAIARLSMIMYELFGDVEEGFYMNGGGEIKVFALRKVLAVTAAMIERNGWLSRGQAFREYRSGQATADFVSNFLWETDGRKREKWFDFSEPEDRDWDAADKAIEWAEGLTEDELTDNDYLWNVHIVTELGFVKERNMGVACSILPVANREYAKRAERKQAAGSEWVGEPKQRLDLELTVIQVIYLESDWGITKLHKMADADGNRFCWFSSSKTLTEGETYKVRGTVKKHNEFKGTKETQLTRCAVAA